ncbi:hypothetical protein K8Q94_01595 [Candidatus Nomurabacteria bacterium]|nr:hypothetical protein [Candidatus Nomurabacteria bacterium]
MKTIQTPVVNPCKGKEISSSEDSGILFFMENKEKNNKEKFDQIIKFVQKIQNNKKCSTKVLNQNMVQIIEVPEAYIPEIKMEFEKIKLPFKLFGNSFGIDLRRINEEHLSMMN